MQESNQSSRVYLLRCWRERGTASGQESQWRFLVEEVLQDGQRRRGFSSLSALIAFLEVELADDEEEVSSGSLPGEIGR
jgi:hypothetical protein